MTPRDHERFPDARPLHDDEPTPLVPAWAIEEVCLDIAAEADAYAEDDDAEEPGYASGLRAAVHDVCDRLLGISWPQAAPYRAGRDTTAAARLSAWTRTEAG